MSDVGEICEAENSKLGSPHVKNPGSSQPTPIKNHKSMKELTYNRSEVQAKPEGYKYSKCLKSYKSASGLGKPVKTKHSPTLHCDDSTIAFSYYSQVKAL